MATRNIFLTLVILLSLTNLLPLQTKVYRTLKTNDNNLVQKRTHLTPIRNLVTSWWVLEIEMGLDQRLFVYDRRDPLPVLSKGHIFLHGVRYRGLSSLIDLHYLIFFFLIGVLSLLYFVFAVH